MPNQADRRQGNTVRVRPTTLLLLVSPFVLLVVFAYVQWATVGLPAVLPAPAPLADDSLAQGFPAWLRVTHYVNFLFIILLVRSGLQILMDHPQGWSGIAESGGLPVAELVKLVRPKPGVRAVAFYSFGEGMEGGQFYDSLSMQNAMRPQTLLAYEMNFEPLNQLHGAPLRLRAENLLGFKMVKWIQAIEFVESVNSRELGLHGRGRVQRGSRILWRVSEYLKQ